MGRRPVWRSLPAPIFILEAALLVAAPLGFTACGPEPDSTADAPGGGAGTSRGAPPTRVLSLVPSATETLLALGAGDLLVGRTDYDTASALAHLPSVGGGLQPSREVILSLRPELVVTFESVTDVETPAFLTRAQIPHLSVRPEGVEDVRDMIARLGEAVGREAAADSVLADLDRELAQIRERAASAPPVRTAYLLGGSPPYVAGPGSLPDDLIRLAGGVNVFADLDQRYASVSPEALLAREIDVLLAAEGTRVEPRIAAGVPVRRVSPAVELPGPRLGAAARSVARALRPDELGAGPGDSVTVRR